MPALRGPHPQNTSPFPSTWLIPNPGPVCSPGWARCGDSPTPTSYLPPWRRDGPRAGCILQLHCQPVEGRASPAHLHVPGAEPGSLLVLNKACGPEMPWTNGSSQMWLAPFGVYPGLFHTGAWAPEHHQPGPVYLCGSWVEVPELCPLPQHPPLPARLDQCRQQAPTGAQRPTDDLLMNGSCGQSLVRPESRVTDAIVVVVTFTAPFLRAVHT